MNAMGSVSINEEAGQDRGLAGSSGAEERIRTAATPSIAPGGEGVNREPDWDHVCESCGAELPADAVCMNPRCTIGERNAYWDRGDHLYHWQKDGRAR